MFQVSRQGETPAEVGAVSFVCQTVEASNMIGPCCCQWGCNCRIGLDNKCKVCTLKALQAKLKSLSPDFCVSNTANDNHKGDKDD